MKGNVLCNVLERGTGSHRITNARPRYIAGTWIALLAVLALNLCSAVLSAQTKPAIVVSQVSWLGKLPGGGLLSGASPSGGSFAVNQNGDVIVSATYGGHIYLFDGKTGAVTTWAFGNPGGVTVDSRNNLYISHVYNSGIYKIPYVNGSYAVADPTSPYPPYCTGNDTVECQFVKAGSSNVKAMAFDASGNFFMATAPSSSGASAIYECPASCQPNPSATSTLIYSDANAVGSLAIDPWGNLFFTDAAFDSGGPSGQVGTNSALNELTYTAGTGFASTPTQLATFTDPTPIGQYNDSLGAVGVDTNGTVYYATQYYTNGIRAFPNNHGVVNTASVYGVSNVGVKLLTLDAKGNIYIAANNGGDSVGKILINNVVVPAAPVGGTATTATATVMVNDGGCSSSPALTFSAQENGTVLDPTSGEFVGVATGTCAGQSGGSYFGATITFTPSKVGGRRAVLTVTDSKNGGSGTATVSGTGQGSLATLDPGVVTSYATGFNSPASVSVDASGNLFVADSGAHTLLKVPAGATTPVAIGSGFTTPSGTAFDAAGNLYVVDSGNNQVVEIPNVAGVLKPSSQVTLVSNLTAFAGTTLSGPSGLAVGPDSTLYIADTGNNRVVTYVLASGAVPGSIGVRATGLNSPMGIRVDASSNLYIANTGAGNVLVYSGSAVTTLSPAGVTTPVGVAVEPSGSVLIADRATGQIVRVPNESGTLTVADAIVIETNPKSAYAIAMDATGNLYTADASGAAVYALQRTASAVNFGSVNAGSSSATATIYLENAGNTALTGGSPIVSAPSASQFTLTAAATNGCAAGATIASGLACGLSTNFSSSAAATPGLYTATSSLSSNALNASSAAITLKATIPGAIVQTITFAPPPASPVVYGVGPVTLTATASSGLAVTFNVVSGPGTVSGNTLTITGGGTVVVAANQAGNSLYSAATQVTQSIVVNQASQTITFTAPTSPVTYSTTPISLTATASSGLAATFSVVSGPGTISGSALTITGAGTVVVAANQAGNSSYSAATQVTQSIVVNQASQALTFTAPTSPVTYGTTPISLTATASSGLAATFSVVSGPGTISGSALTITGAGTVVVAANQAGNSSYSAAAQVTQSVVVNQASQSITFAALTSPVAYSATPITLTATASSGLAVTFSVVSGPATVSGSTLKLTGTGTVVVAANQAGNTNYTAATQVTQSVVVNAAGPAASPSFTPAAGTYNAAQSVTISDATSGAVIYYTTDGSVPTTSSSVYSGAISVKTTETIQAIAVATGYTVSPVASAAYTLVTPGFTIAINPAALTIPSGSLQGAVGLTVTPVNGFNAAVTFACSGLPTGASCSFTPATVTPTAGAATTAFSISVPASSAAVHYHSRPLVPGTTVALALCFFGLRKRRGVQILLVLAMGVFGFSLLSGCSTSTQQSSTSTVTVTATSGSLQQTATLSLTVQ